MNKCGSPPRVWGIHRLVQQHIDRYRFTPTCVGNTRTRSQMVSPMPVHPHVCGEYSYSILHYDDSCGSPPRVWGIRASSCLIRSTSRFTPTCVGNTFEYFNIDWNTSVHPHVCGEYPVSKSGRSSSIGSPPRVWGIHLGVHVCNQPRRFTPTCVGNT